LSNTPIIPEIDGLLNQIYPPDGPGAAAIVVKDGEVLHRQGYGLANLEHNLPVEPDMVFKVGSVTKQFTAVSILMLVEEGKLSLDDPIEQFLPGYPTHGHRITIEHLLTHTSGIKSYTSLPEWEGLFPKNLTADEMIEGFKYKPMDFAPGRRFLYNNSAYFLLGVIIEKVSGLSYEAFLQQRIFDPLGMKRTYGYTGQRLIPKRTSGYEKSEGGYQNCIYISMTHPGAAGVLSSTVDDLAFWDESLYTEKLVKSASLQRAWTPYTLNDGSSTHYGYGWGVEQFQDLQWIRHGGGIPGFMCEALRVPQEQLFVAVLSNLVGGGKTPEETAYRIALLTLGKPAPEPQPVELSAAALERLTGVYENPEGEAAHILVKEGKLFQSFPADHYEELISPLSENECCPKWNVFYRLRFLNDAAGSVTAFEVVNPYGRVQETYRKTEQPLPEAPGEKI
jgi:D-alanyl-D-alanine carboxypeptidase